MAIETKYKKITDFFNPITNPAGGLPPSSKPVLKNVGTPSFNANFARTLPTPAPAWKAAADGKSIRDLLGSSGAAPMNPVKPTTTMGPVAPAAVSTPSPTLFGGKGMAPATTPTPTPTAVKQPDVPSQWMRADGTMKTPEEIASDIAGTLKKSQENGDIGTLAGNQFGGGKKTAAQLAAEAAQINNTRNDIAVGENDPYKVAAASGIAYTPQELKAIESAYAGIYDPAITTALAKVEQKQTEDAAAAEAKRRQDEMRLQSTLDATAPFTLGQDQVRYGADGKPLAVGLSSNSGSQGSGVYAPGANPTVDAFIKGVQSGTYKASDVPDEYKALVAQGMAANRPVISQSSNEAISVIDQLLGYENLDDIAGIPNISTFIPGSASQPKMQLAKQLAGMLSLENRDQLKGSGAISDFEFKVLRDAASALGISDSGRTSLSEDDFRTELGKIQLKLQVGPTEFTDDQLLHMRDVEGMTPDEIREFNQFQSFGNVGNTTASAGTGNRPQRNNNPGNVKAGGLADPLAIGTDDQGHLIFPDAATGFKAMTADITAKINGNSRFLPPNPTISQLGKVYAEDQNWPNSVARILGVSPDTPTKNIPINQLVQAIATQEGFYA